MSIQIARSPAYRLAAISAVSAVFTILAALAVLIGLTANMGFLNRILRSVAVNPVGGIAFILVTTLISCALMLWSLLSLSREEQKQEHFFKLSLDLLCIAGFDGYFKRVNPVWETTLGFTAAELMARPYIDFIHPEDREATLAESQKISAGAEVISFENRYLCKDGSYRWLQWNAAPIPALGLVYAVARDVTHWKDTEQASLHLAAIVECSSEAIMSKSLDGAIRSWNPSAQRLFGYSAAEIVGKSMSLLIPPERADEEAAFAST